MNKSSKEKPQMYEDSLSLIIIGDQFVGKTSLMKRFTENVFSDDILGTVGIECFKKVHKIKNTPYLIKIWDTCGQERFRSLTANYYRNADGVILVFDVTEQESFENLKSWINSLNENTNISLPRVVIANKLDLPDRVVNSLSIKQFQKENKVEIFEGSAKLGKNINEAFEYIIKEIIKSKQKEEDKLKIDTFETRDSSRCAC